MTKPCRDVVFMVYACMVLPVFLLSAIDLFSIVSGPEREVDAAGNYFMAQLSFYWALAFSLAYIFALILILLELIRGYFGLLKGVLVVNFVWVLIISLFIFFDFSKLFSELGVAVLSTLFSAIAFAAPCYFIKDEK